MFRDVIENVLIRPERKSSRDMWNAVPVAVIQLAGGVVDSHIGIRETSIGNDPGIEAILSWHPLPFLLREQWRKAEQHKKDNP